MLRRLFLICLLVGVLAGLAGVGWFFHSADPRYDATEWICRERYHRYDELIAAAARSRELDPMLVKALIWRESRFHPDKHGSSGERGLMQIGPAAASEWAKAERPQGTTPDDLLDPKTNVQAGTWLLARALHRWQQDTGDPVPFALAEYNAGHSRVQRWATAAGERSQPAHIAPTEFLAQISIPSTRQYVETVEARWQFYQRRGRF